MKKGILVVVFALFVGMASSFAQAFFPTEKAAFYDKLSSYLNSSTAKQDREEAAVIMQGFGALGTAITTTRKPTLSWGFASVSMPKAVVRLMPTSSTSLKSHKRFLLRA